MGAGASRGESGVGAGVSRGESGVGTGASRGGESGVATLARPQSPKWQADSGPRK